MKLTKKSLVHLANCLVLAGAASSVALSAHASKARLLALGQDTEGSEYIEDTRSIFLNPAMLNRVGDFANFEFGGSARPNPGTPNAEGGLFHALPMGNGLRAGVQLGRRSFAESLFSFFNTTTGGFGAGANSLIAPQNTVEAVVAGGADMKWGASILYGNAESKAEIPAGASAAYPNKTANTVSLHGGVASGQFDAFAHLELVGKSTAEVASGITEKVEIKPTLRVGGAYEMSKDQRAYVDAHLITFSTGNGAAADRDGSINDINFGFAQFFSLEANTRLFASAGLTYSRYQWKNSAPALEAKSEQIYIPIVFGIESEANDWLVLRASISQHVILDRRKTATVTNFNDPNSTTAGAGVGLRWRKLLLDATLAGVSTGTINATDFLGNASLTYLF